MGTMAARPGCHGWRWMGLEGRGRIRPCGRFGTSLEAAVIAAGEGHDESLDDEAKEMMQHGAALLQLPSEVLRLCPRKDAKIKRLQKWVCPQVFCVIDF